VPATDRPGYQGFALATVTDAGSAVQDARLRIGWVDGLVLVDVGGEGLARGVQRPQQLWFLAMPAIQSHPREAEAVGAGLLHHGQCMLA